MAIATNDAINKFAAALDTVSAGGGTSAVSSGAYSASGDVVSGGWTNDEDAPKASFVLKFQYPSGTITTGGVQLFARLLSVDSTNDEPALTTNWIGHFLGSFRTGTGMSAATDYYVEEGPIALPAINSSQKYGFYLLNNCGVTISAGWTLKARAISIGPSA